jgi:putative ABC transport system substrate-binding protein
MLMPTCWSHLRKDLSGHVGRIRAFEDAGESFVLQWTKFEFVINLKTAEGLGIQLPQGLSAVADEVIE